jgi:hypothetical protein
MQQQVDEKTILNNYRLKLSDLLVTHNPETLRYLEDTYHKYIKVSNTNNEFDSMKAGIIRVAFEAYFAIILKEANDYKKMQVELAKKQNSTNQ